MDILSIIISFIIFFLLTDKWQKSWLPWIIKKFREGIESAIEEMREEDIKKIDSDTKLGYDDRKTLKKEIRKEKYFGSEGGVDYRIRRLNYITKMVGWAEIIFFAPLLFFILKDNSGNLEKANFFFTILGGWIAIKTIVSYDQWSHKRAGKAYFYISLFGTFFNIIFAISIGIFYFFFL